MSVRTKTPLSGAAAPGFSRRETGRRGAMALVQLVLVFGFVGVASAGGQEPDESSAAERPPNIVLILADDLGQETLGCYGGTSYETPRIDRLAEQGLRFRHAYSMPVCHPTRIALLTGRYPFRLNHPAWGSFPPGVESQTVAQVLQRAGYATAVAGKWQLTLLRQDPNHPRRLGFQESCLFGWHEGPRYHDPLIWQDGAILEGTDGRYGPDIYTQFLIDFMARHRREPFFAFYSMALCHDVTDDLKEPVPYGPRGRYDSYGEMVEAMDERVGRIVDALERLGISGRTIVLFTGDNGTPVRSIVRVENGKLVREKITSRRGDEVIPGGKGQLTDAGTRVPLVVRWPGRVAAGTVTDALVDLSDLLPTFADLAGTSGPEGVTLDGRSFAPVLRGKPGVRGWVFAESGARAWVRTQRWKLYRNGRLFDMEKAPRETRALAEADLTAEATVARRRLREALASLGLRE